MDSVFHGLPNVDANQLVKIDFTQAINLGLFILMWCTATDHTVDVMA